jgi:hypothetical protein
MSSNNDSMNKTLEAVRKEFSVFFKDTNSGKALMSNTFWATFGKGLNCALTTVPETGSILFDRTKLNIAPNPDVRQPIHDTFVRWLGSPESGQFNITEVQGMDSEQAAAEMVPPPLVAKNHKNNSGDGAPLVDGEIARLNIARDEVVAKLNAAAQQAIESAVAKVNEAAVAKVNEAVAQTTRDQQAERALLKAGFDAEKAETAKRVELLEAQLAHLRVERASAAATAVVPPLLLPTVSTTTTAHEMERMRQAVESLEQRVHTLTMEPRRRAATAAAVLGPSDAEEEVSSSSLAGEQQQQQQPPPLPRRNNKKRGREEEEEENGDDSSSPNNNNSTSVEEENQRRRRMAPRGRKAGGSVAAAVVTQPSPNDDDDLASLPYRAVRHCIAAFFGADTVRSLEVRSAAAAAAKKK